MITSDAKGEVLVGGTRFGLSVIHVAETVKGGIATYLKNILPYQERRYGADNVVVIAPAAQVGEMEQFSERAVVFRSGKNRLLNAVRAALRLRDELGCSPVCVVHLHSSFAGVVCRLMLWSSRRRRTIVYCPHGWSFLRGTRLDGLAAFVERILAGACDAIVCVSHYEKEAALRRKLPEAKLHVIVNGIHDLHPRKKEHSDDMWTPGTLRLIFIGRLDRQKGFDILIAALKLVDRPLELHAFGGSVTSDKSSHETLQCVHMHGWSDFKTIEPYLRSCDAVVMPSRWEGLPYTALEAMRAEKAIIGAEVGGLCEVIENNVNGLLVRPEDADSLAAIIQNVDSSKLAEMGRRGREKFRSEYTAERMETASADLYEKLQRHPQRFSET